MEPKMNVIKEILQALGVESASEMDIGESYTVERDEFMDLTIEKIYEDKLSVAHYYTQRGDLMRDPEIVFDVSGDGWFPIEYRQDPGQFQRDKTGLDLHGFVDTWNKNLRNQGFVEMAKNSD
jgi:hypothetical protein